MSKATPPLSRHKLPGFGLALNFVPYVEYTTKYNVYPTEDEGIELFPNALDSDAQLRLTTLREFTMMRFMNQLTDKPGWDTKVLNSQMDDIDITERMVEYCIDELRHKSKIFKNTGVITAYDGDVVKSDLTIPPFLKAALRTAAAPLEHVTDAHRDWHPGSNETVLDLVHPSLFPVVYGRTRILDTGVVGLDDCVKRCGDGQTLSVPPYYESHSETTTISLSPYSRKFQWLPCEVEFDGDEAKITSYINNLHPHVHKSLYDVIEQIVTLTIPLWNQVLTPLMPPHQSVPRISYTKCEYEPPRPLQLSNESMEDFWEREEQWEHDARLVLKPEPGAFVAPVEDKKMVDLKGEFAKTGLQVIVKLANIHLTPEKPEYAGGTWHVEGQLNEHICATALYYYDNFNVTESVLSFRQQSAIADRADEIPYEQDRHDWLSEIFGCEQHGDAIQYIGDVITKEDRLLAFPNIFQHRVGSFSLADKTKPGHRKILALFLVDPHIKIISSAHVPCQQKDWWANELAENGVFSGLPNEMVKEVVDNVEDFPISSEEAKELRVKLMEERKMFVKLHDKGIKSARFSLCEH